MINAATQNLSLTPLGAGDLIDRAVRLYRQNFFTLIRIAASPVIVSAIGSVLLTLGWRGFYTTSATTSFALYFLLLTAGGMLWVVGYLLTLMVMGGATRNLVRHLLWHEAVTARETFRNVRSRFWSLLGATVIVSVVILIISIICLYGGMLLVMLAVGVGALLYAVAAPIIGIIIGSVCIIAATYLSVWIYFLLIGKIAYVPQILLVEGQGVFASIGRSVSLSSQNWRRLAALFLFTLFATYSALMVFLFPLLWYAQANGIPIFDVTGNEIPPVWYSVTWQLINQLSFILLAPIWMLGLSLMYVDERVRHEAYDVELMAARNLGEMPPLANPQHNPLRPALGVQAQLPPNFSAQHSPSRNSTLGLG
ncbi:MAG: hypothetical protein ABI954_02220 [Pyrinomonadaceae bacterium]